MGEIRFVSALVTKIVSSPHVRKPKTVLDSGFHAVDSEFQQLDSRFFVSGLSGLQSLEGFRIP